MGAECTVSHTVVNIGLYNQRLKKCTLEMEVKADARALDSTHAKAQTLTTTQSTAFTVHLLTRLGFLSLRF